MGVTAEGIIAFEKDIAAEFNSGNIRAPIHLDGGNEAQLVDIFKGIAPTDYVYGTWRMHAKCLLHGVPPAELKAAIMRGRSITLCFPQYRILSSAIVGGIMPIALGVAWQIKRNGGAERVHCFVGDMAAEGGLAHECFKYSSGWCLPVEWYVEDNGKSVCSDTKETWGNVWRISPKRFRYTLSWPHSGSGRRIQF